MTDTVAQGSPANLQEQTPGAVAMNSIMLTGQPMCLRVGAQNGPPSYVSVVLASAGVLPTWQMQFLGGDGNTSKSTSERRTGTIGGACRAAVRSKIVSPLCRAKIMPPPSSSFVVATSSLFRHRMAQGNTWRPWGSRVASILRPTPRPRRKSISPRSHSRPAQGSACVACGGIGARPALEAAPSVTTALLRRGREQAGTPRRKRPPRGAAF
jgi:hypothetical protein